MARDIARVLGCGKKTNSYMEGKDYIVTWALGHLVTLADPEEYGEQYKSWNMDTLPMLPQHWKLVVIRQTSRQYHAVKEQIFRKDVSDIIIATDAGREGELVARWILDKAGNKKPLKRLWISSVTDKAIREGFAHLRPGKDYENLYRAAVARAESDWVVGINATRALTCKYNAQLSCGRVQTPTLAMIAAREEEIRRFRPQTYYGLKASAGGITFTWTDSRTGSGRTFDREKVDSIRRSSAAKLHITEVKKKAKKTYSPALYDLTALQREANQRYGYSAKETLNIMQRLYENHKVLTYPRTDSRYLTSDMTGTLKERLKACAVGPYRKTAARLSMQEIRANKSFVDNSKVSDHHAIIPTEQFVQLEHMSSDERRIYDMVVRRFLAVLSPACEYEETSLTGTLGAEKFHAKGNVILKAGWREVYGTGWEDADDDADEESADLISGQSLPEVKEGTDLAVTALTVTEGKTKPPAYFTEGTLIAAPGKISGAQGQGRHPHAGRDRRAWNCRHPRRHHREALQQLPDGEKGKRDPYHLQRETASLPRPCRPQKSGTDCAVGAASEGDLPRERVRPQVHVRDRELHKVSDRSDQERRRHLPPRQPDKA